MKRLVLIMTTFLVFFLGMNAQDSTELNDKVSKRIIARSKYKRAIMIVPQYFSRNGIRIDYEFRMNRNSIDIGSIFYMDKSSEDVLFIDNNYRSMIGVGLDVAYKINLRNPNKIFVPYSAINGGLNWKQYNTDGETWDNYLKTHITYFEGVRDINIYKMELDLLLGFQITPHPRFIIDVSGGVGGKYYIADSYQDFVKDDFGEYILSLAYTGITPAFNLKFGFKF